MARSERRQVWDLPVRVFHWTLATAFVAAYVTNRLGVAYFKYHAWCGYTVIVLVLFRLTWGFVGTQHARFGNFVRGPATTLRYAWHWVRGRERPHAGHNPLGAWMVLALLVTLLLQAITGLFGNDEIFNLGPLYGHVSDALSLQLTSLHRQLFYWIAAAVVIHILAVIVHLVVAKENLVHAMITGRKPSDRVTDDEAIRSSRTWLALLLVCVFAVALAWVVDNAPVPTADVSYD